MVNSYEIMKRHMGIAEEIDLGDGEKIMFAPLPAEYLPELLLAQSALEKSAKGKDIDRNTIEMLTTCIIASLKAATPKPPEISEEEYSATISTFTARYYYKFFEKLMTMNTCGVTAEDATKINLIKEKIAKAQNAGGASGIVKPSKTG